MNAVDCPMHLKFLLRSACAAQVHAYLAALGGKTAYLSELKSGSEVLVVDPLGRQRAAVVGRIKVEQRPLVSLLCDSVLFKGGSWNFGPFISRLLLSDG